MRPYIDCHNHIGRTIDRVPPVGQNTAMCLTRFAQTHIHAAISMSTAVGSPIARGIVDIRLLEVAGVEGGGLNINIFFSNVFVPRVAQKSFWNIWKSSRSVPERHCMACCVLV